MIALLSIILSIACRTVGELQQHWKLKWSRPGTGFWDSDSDIRKYKYINGVIQLAPKTWYYKLFKLKYKERWPTSATFTIFATDGYHFMQSASFILLALGVSLLSGWSFWLTWIAVVAVHATVYRVFQK